MKEAPGVHQCSGEPPCSPRASGKSCYDADSRLTAQRRTRVCRRSCQRKPKTPERKSCPAIARCRANFPARRIETMFLDLPTYFAGQLRQRSYWRDASSVAYVFCNERAVVAFSTEHRNTRRRNCTNTCFHNLQVGLAEGVGTRYCGVALSHSFAIETLLKILGTKLKLGRYSTGFNPISPTKL